MKSWEHIHNRLNQVGVVGFPVEIQIQDSVCDTWLKTFFHGVKRQTGEWVHLGFRWHAYSYRMETAVEGTEADRMYMQQRQTNLLAYFEIEDVLFDCHGAIAPDMTDLNSDIYVFPKTLEWSMAFTHERSMGLGPYFAQRPAVSENPQAR